MSEPFDQPIYQSAVLKVASLQPEDGGMACALTPDDLRKSLPNRKAIKMMDRKTQLACGAFIQGMGLEARFHDMAGLVIATGAASIGEGDIASALAMESLLHAIPSRLEKNLQPLWLLGRLPNMTSAHLAIQFQISGPSQTCGGGSLAGIQAISCASRWLQTGGAREVIAGASESYLEEHWKIALKKRDREPTESATLLHLAQSHEHAISWIDGPIHIRKSQFAFIQEKFQKAFSNMAVFCEVETCAENSKSWNFHNVQSTWRVGAEMEQLVAWIKAGEPGAIVRLLDGEHAVIFILTPRNS